MDTDTEADNDAGNRKDNGSNTRRELYYSTPQYSHTHRNRNKSTTVAEATLQWNRTHGIGQPQSTPQEHQASSRPDTKSMTLESKSWP